MEFCARNVKRGWSHHQLVEWHLLDEVLRRRRSSHPQSRRDLVSRRGPLTVLQYPGEERESSAAQRKRSEREWLRGPARPCDDQLVRDADWWDPQPGRQHDLLEQRYVLKPVNR